MEFSLDSYRMLGRQCGAAHRIARDTGNVKAATDLFTTLWSRLDRETLQDHCDARAAFNAAFGPAYRGGVNPPCVAPPPPPPRQSDDRTDGTDEYQTMARRERRKSVALDCAAFYASKTT